MAKRDQDVHFLASKEEVERIHQKMDELGIRSTWRNVTGFIPTQGRPKCLWRPPKKRR